MYKSGLIFGAGMFFLVLFVSVVTSPFCGLCIAVLLGLASGFVAGAFDKPSSSAEATKKGAVAGAITGVMGIAANLIAAVLAGIFYQSNQSVYVSLCPGTELPDPNVFWVVELGLGVCTAIVNVVLTTGLGVAGSAIWFSTAGKKTSGKLPPTGLISS